MQDDATAQLCLVALASGHKRAVELGISGLNKLVSHKALGGSLVAALVPRLSKAVDLDENDSNLLLKCIQLIVALWNPPAYRIHGEELAKALGTLFRLAATPRVAMIHQAAEASLRQIFMEFYDQATGTGAAPADAAAKVEHDLTLLDLSRLLKDMCNVTQGQEPVWLPAPLILSDVGFGFDRLEELLAHPDMPRLILAVPDLASVVRDRLFPLMQQSVQTALVVGVSVGAALKTLRTASQLLGHYHTVSTPGVAGLLDAVVAPLEGVPAATSAGPVPWPRFLALTTLRVWLNLPELVMGLGSQSVALLDRVTARLSAFVQGMFSWETFDFHVMDVSLSSSGPNSAEPASAAAQEPAAAELTRRLRLFPQFKSNMTELPSAHLTQASLVLTALHSLLGVVDTMAANAEKARSGNAVVREFAASGWPSLLAAFSLFLSKSRDEAFILLVLRGYQSFCRTSALIDLSTPRDAFLTSLCKFAKPHTQSSSPAGVAVGMGVVAELEREGLAGATRLNKKNVLTMKILLNISHSLAPYLGESAWAIVLDTLHQLFVILSLRRRARPPDASPVAPSASHSTELPTADSGANLTGNGGSPSASSATAGAATGSGDAAAFSSPLDPFVASRDDEDMLFNTLESLFSSTKFMEVNGLVTLVSGLIALSRSRLSELVSSTPLKDAAAQHLFPLTKAFQVVAADLGRLDHVWDTLLHHVVSVAATHRNPDVRIFAARRMTELIEKGVANASLFAVPMQDRLLEALEQLVTQSVHPEVRIEAVESLFRVLGSSGPSLSSSAWPVVLSVLMAVGLDTTDSALLSLGFRCAQLVVADYVPVVPVDCLSVLISMVGCYAGKTIVDVNINITAVGLLWNIADSLAKEEGKIRGDAVQEEASIAPRSSQVSTLSTWDGLWYALLQELVIRADNRRAEIRHSSLQTLFGCLYTYGGRYITRTCWCLLWPQVLLPLLPWLVRNCQSASADAPASQGLLVDHARNSDLKQWQETHVILLNGLVKVFKTFFEEILAPESTVLTSISHALLDHIEKILLASRPTTSGPELDVVVSGVLAAKDIIIATYSGRDSRASVDARDRVDISDVSNRCWAVWLRAARYQRTSERPLPQRLLGAFVDAVSEAYPRIHGCANAALHWLVAIAAELPLFPLEFVGELVILQKQVLSVMQSAVDGSLVVPPSARPELRSHVVAVLLTYLARVISHPFECTCFNSSSIGDGLAPISPVGLLKAPANARRELPLAERALSTLSALLVTQSDNIPIKEACSLFRDVVTVCGEVMLVRHDAPFQRSLVATQYSPDASRLWFISQDVLRQTARICLGHIHEFFTQEQCAQLWTNLLDCVEAFILASQAKDAASIEADVGWIGDIRTTMMRACVHTDPNLQMRMFCLLLDAAEQVDREGVVDIALLNVFSIFGSEQTVDRAAAMLPVFLARATDVISRFVVDDQTSGALPLPSARMRQMTLLLSRLLELQMPASLWGTRHPVELVDQSGQRHLFELFSVFCDCVTTKEREVQICLKAIFQRIGLGFTR